MVLVKFEKWFLIILFEFDKSGFKPYFLQSKGTWKCLLEIGPKTNTAKHF